MPDPRYSPKSCFLTFLCSFKNLPNYCTVYYCRSFFFIDTRYFKIKNNISMKCLIYKSAIKFINCCFATLCIIYNNLINYVWKLLPMPSEYITNSYTQCPSVFPKTFVPRHIVDTFRSDFPSVLYELSMATEFKISTSYIINLLVVKRNT